MLSAIAWKKGGEKKKNPAENTVVAVVTFSSFWKASNEILLALMANVVI